MIKTNWDGNSFVSYHHQTGFISDWQNHDLVHIISDHEINCISTLWDLSFRNLREGIKTFQIWKQPCWPLWLCIWSSLFLNLLGKWHMEATGGQHLIKSYIYMYRNMFRKNLRNIWEYQFHPPHQCIALLCPRLKAII